MKFHDRQDAGKQLAEALHKYRTAASVVLTVPQGGVLCAAPIAVALNAPLDLVFVKEFAHPKTPEYILGAVNEHGEHILRPEASVVDPRWLEAEIARHKYALRKQRHSFLTNRPSISLRGKTVFLVDDGLISHFTMQLAVKQVRAHVPEKIIIAAPVASPQTVEKLQEYADAVIVIEQPQYLLTSIGNYYAMYNTVTEREIQEALRG